MTTIIKLVIASILALIMTSCNFSFGVDGNGNVQTVERTVNGTYDEIEVSRGLEVYLTQSDTESISVQADENLQDIIKTEIVGNVLKIYAEDNIRFSQAQKVMVNFKNVFKISASSGSDVYCTNTFNVVSVQLKTESGSAMKLDIQAQSIDCSSSSGRDLKLSGTTKNLKAEASSGSNINASELIAETSRVEASSGADIAVHASIQINRGLMQQFGQVEMLDFHDLTVLEKKMQEIIANKQTPLLFSDSICSMGGVMPLDKLLDLSNKYNGYLYLDDAHGMSVYGKNGAGYVMQTFNHCIPERLILTTSLGKAFGTCGGVVIFKNKNDAQFVKRFCSTYMFSGTLVNSLINVCIESGKIHLSTDIKKLQQELLKKIAIFDNLIMKKSKIINLGNNTPIRGLIIGDEFTAIEKGLYLKDNGYLGTVATYPIRKKGEAIIRMLICANHTDKEIKQVCKIINYIL